jgi:phage/plasmid-associated DNA primase
MNTMTTTLTETENVFYLPKPKPSIFTYSGLEMREYPNFELIYGFVNNKMGIKLRKALVAVYGDEQTHYKKYIRQTKWLDDLQYVSVKYYQAQHGWGRVNACDSLSLSLFHRPSRHSFCESNYIDCDMDNMQPSVLLNLANHFGSIPSIEGLKEYCADPKKCRQDIIRHYCLTDIICDDGCIISAKNQAKQLPIRLAFGGGIRRWKGDYKVKRCDDLPMIKKMETCLNALSIEINKANLQIREELEKDEKFSIKSEEEKLRSVTALFAQTWERIIQEECVSYLIKNYPSVKLIDIIPSQDGIMLLKNQTKNINFEDLFTNFTKLIQKKFKLNITWSIKPFDEAITIIPSKKMPIDVFYEDLEKGERFIAELIYPAFKNEVKFYHNEKLKSWYVFQKSGLWEESSSAPITRIIKQLQDYIDEEKDRCWNEYKNEQSEEKRKKLDKKELAIKNHYRKVGSASYSKHLCLYLEMYLKDNEFVKKFNKTAGKFPFKDGMLDLKTGIFTEGFKYDDYITFTTQIKYLDLNPSQEKTDFIKSKFKQITNNSDTHLDYYLSVLGHAMTGDASLEKALYYIIDGTEFKGGNNGKTFVFSLLMDIFPEFVKQTDIKAFEDGYAKAHKHLAMLKNARIAFVDEGTKKTVDASLIKKIGDGMVIENEIMHGTTEKIDVMFKFFCCSNHKFKVGKGEEAVFNRYKELNFASHFDLSGDRREEDPDNLLFIGDKNLTQTLLRDCRDEIISLIIDYAKRYYQKGIPDVPAEYLKATMETKLLNNPFAVWWNKTYSVKEENKLFIDDIVTLKGNMTREEVISNLKNIGLKYDKDLSCGSRGKKGGILGWVKKEEGCLLEVAEVGEPLVHTI